MTIKKSIQNRIKSLNQKGITNGKGPVVYWMSRDQRANDNYALFAAQQKAQENKVPLIVVFCLQKSFLGVDQGIFDFMINGLMQVEKDLNDLNIPFVVLQSDPVDVIPEFLHNISAQALYADFSPLKIGIKWRKDVAEKIHVPFYEVDTHNIVPAWEVSNKREFSARTIRPKIHSKLEEYLCEMPKLSSAIINTETVSILRQTCLSGRQAQHDKNIELSIKGTKGIDWKKMYPHYCHPGVASDATIGSHKSCFFIGGRLVAEKKLKEFIENKLPKYSTLKNDPNEDVLSCLSPYLHFGQISAQRVALEVLGLASRHGELAESMSQRMARNQNINSFLEELIVRRELAENFCYHTPNYDTLDAFPAWAKETLNKHRKDKREYTYTKDQFENAQTRDPLWNASQNQMLKTGKMHGYMRMYWAKKILEWTSSPEEALETAINLNDKYELDGRDPNGYAGIAWSIGGLHDRPWFERPIFGLVRYMNRSGAEKKFDVKKYIARWAH